MAAIRLCDSVQVPLGRRFGQILTEEQHFSPEKLIHQLHAKDLEVGLQAQNSRATSIGWQHVSGFVTEPCMACMRPYMHIWQLLLRWHRASSSGYWHRWASLSTSQIPGATMISRRSPAWGWRTSRSCAEVVERLFYFNLPPATHVMPWTQAWVAGQH